MHAARLPVQDEQNLGSANRLIEASTPGGQDEASAGHQEHDLSEEQGTLQVEPRDRVPWWLRKSTDEGSVELCAPGLKLVASYDSMAVPGMEPVQREAALFEHVAKMSRFFDLQPKVKQGSVPPVRFRSTVFPQPEDYDRPAPRHHDTDMSTESESDTHRDLRPQTSNASKPPVPDERINRRVPVKLRHDPLGGREIYDSEAPSETGSSIHERADQERLLNKLRQLEKLKSSASEKENTQNGKSKKKKKKAIRDRERKKVQRELEKVLAKDTHSNRTTPSPAAKRRQEARSRRWHRHRSPEDVDKKLGRNMRAAPLSKSLPSTPTKMRPGYSAEPEKESILKPAQSSETETPPMGNKKNKGGWVADDRAPVKLTAYHRSSSEQDLLRQMMQQSQVQNQLQKRLERQLSIRKHRQCDSDEAGRSITDAFPLSSVMRISNSVPASCASSQRDVLSDQEVASVPGGYRVASSGASSARSALERILSDGSANGLVPKYPPQQETDTSGLARYRLRAAPPRKQRSEGHKPVKAWHMEEEPQAVLTVEVGPSKQNGH